MISRVEYLTLKARVNEELDNIKRLETALKRLKLFPGIKTDTINGLPLEDEISCRVIGSYLHDYYCGLEKIFVHIARGFGGTLPMGEQWHKDLLEEMTLEIPGVRTALISKKTLAKLDELRGFRHIFRNAYGFSIDPVREQALLADLSGISSAAKKDIKAFFAEMDKLILE
ncbi:MAG TPA: hypothetical protein GX404_04020 [Syntrophomonadaceae bacterium]|nr:hypothetical protein [Syntrophomonadaceae bacterium]